MPLRSTDNFVIDRNENNFKLPAEEIKSYLQSNAVVSTVGPQFPVDGTLWYEPTGGDLYVWNEEVIPNVWTDTTDPRYISITTNGVSRSLNSKLQEIHSVKDYGAVGNGVVDDTAAIQMAISKAIPGGAVYFPRGNYRITDLLTIPVDPNNDCRIVLYGDGMNSSRIVTDSDRGAFYSFNGSNIAFADLRIDLSTGVGAAIWFSTVDGNTHNNYRVIRCAFDHCDVAIRSEGRFTRIQNSVINDARILLWNCARDATISGNTISLTTNFDGITPEFVGARAALHIRRPNNSSINDVPWTTFLHPDNVQIYENQFVISGNANIAIAVHGGRNISIVENTIDASGAVYITPQNYQGIIDARVVVNTANIGEWSLDNLNIIRNKIIAGKGYHCIYSGNLLSRVSYHTIVENNIFDGIESSLSAILFDSVHGYVVSGNFLNSNVFSPNAFLVSNSTGSIYNNTDNFGTSSVDFNNNRFVNETRVFSPLITNKSHTPIVNINSHQFLSWRPNGFNSIVINQCPTSTQYTGFVLGTFQALGIPSNRNWFHCVASDSLGDNFIIYGNGDVENRTGIYGAICDIKFKQDIQTATSQWTDISRLQLRKFQWANGKDKKDQLGFVAQEVDRICPGLVHKDEESGLYSIKYSLIYMKAFIALQEAMNRIEILENDVYELSLTT